MNIRISLWSLPETTSYPNEVTVSAMVDLGSGEIPTTIRIEGPSEALLLVSRLCNVLRDMDRSTKMLRNLIELGHFLEGFECPRCTMNAMGKEK